MGIFSSLQSLVGGSDTHYESAKHYYNQSSQDATKAFSEAGGVLSNVFSPTTMTSTIGSFLGYEHIAGRIISANTAAHLANFFTAGEFSLIETVTKVAATQLVANPVGCMVGLMATSALITNPKGIFDAVAGTFKRAYHTVAATSEIVCAGANLGLGVLSDVLESGDIVESHIADWLDPTDALDHFASSAKSITSYANPLFDMIGDASVFDASL